MVNTLWLGTTALFGQTQSLGRSFAVICRSIGYAV